MWAIHYYYYFWGDRPSRILALLMHDYLFNLTSSVCVHLVHRRISHIQPFLSVSTTKTCGSIFMQSQMDYCNSTCQSFLVDKLPKGLEQCCIYCLPLAKSRPCYTFLLCEIHWQPPQAHIDYKITPKCYCCLHSVTSAYLLQILQLPPPSVCLCCPPQMRNSANAASPAQILKLATTFSSNCVGIQIL